MSSFVCQGNCYVWNMAGGIGEEVTQLIPKTKIPAHNRYSLRCKFSPDSTWVVISFSLQEKNYYFQILLLCHPQVVGYLLCWPDLQDLEDIKLLAHDRAEHQEQQSWRDI